MKKIDRLYIYCICIEQRKDVSRALDLFGELRYLLKQITNQTNIRYLEDGRIGVLVNSSNDLAVLHTSQMLDSSRDTNGQVQLRGNNLTSLTDLKTVISVATVNSSTRGTNSGAKSVSKREHYPVKLLLGLETTSTRNDLGSGSEIRAIRFGEVFREPFGGSFGLGVGTSLDGSRTGTGLLSAERRSSHGDDLDGVGRLDGGNGVTGVDRADKGLVILNGSDIGDLLDVEESGNAGQQALAEGAVTGDDVGVATLLDVLNQQRSKVLGETLHIQLLVTVANGA